jgi:triacylglycerol lipase
MEELFRLFDTGKFLPGNALALAYASQLAYPGARDINPGYKNDEELEADMERKAHQAKQWGFDNFNYVYSQEKKILALIIGNHTDIIVAFRGTVSNNFSNWLTDIQLLPVPFGSFGKVHKGFRDAVDSVWPEIRSHIGFTENRNVRLTGHSMGGALALLAGTRFVDEYSENLVKEIYTFGQPRVGDKDFKQAVNQSYLNGSVYKFANYNDMVTVVPPGIKKIIGYVDVGHILYFNKEGLLGVKTQLSEFGTVMDFLTGYFRKQQLPGKESKKTVHNWRTFRRFFKRKFREKQEPGSGPAIEEADWQGFKRFFTSELPTLPRRQRPQKTLQMVMELFVKLFIKINPYGVHTHVITTYIDNLKKNMDADSLIKT